MSGYSDTPSFDAGDQTYEQVELKPPHWNNDRRYFYKYMTPATAKVVLVNRTLRFSSPSLLNDPFDMGFDLQLHIDPKSLKPRVLEAMWEAHYAENPPLPANAYGRLVALVRPQFPRLDRQEFEGEFGDAVDESIVRMHSLEDFHGEIRKHMGATKVLCLTEAPDNLLMWAHYAAWNTGVVLRLRSLPEKDSMFGAAKPVRYTSEMPTLLNEDQIVALLSGSGSLMDGDLLEKLIYTKSAEWTYEREWRISLGLGYSPGSEFEDLRFGGDELDAVIFGTRTTEADQREISALARAQNPGVAFLRAQPARDAFALQLVEL
jgi:hypothetical protein